MADPTRIVIQGPGNFAYRLEIHDFVKDKRLFTLYVRALQSLQNVAEGDDKSFFAVGGIHGLPYATWNGANGSFQGTDDPNWSFGGYCTHGTVIFPTWHRPYIMLYEQFLQSSASQIATQFTVDKEAWAQAALQFRQPYWDWAKYALPPDEVIRSSTVTITGFDGRDVTVENPLLRYKFKAKLPLGYFEGTEFANWQTTLRQPNANGKENINRLVSQLNSAHNKTRTDTVLLLTNVRDWDGFSNHNSTENSMTNSLESIHDNIHVQIGGSGHMGDPAVAGFDPIFYLHHCNVDRMISLWSGMHPDLWVTAGAGPPGGAFYLPPDANVDTNTDLEPFWNSSTAPTFWKSSQVTSTSPLGYAYADFQGVDLNDPNAVRDKVVQIIRQYMQPGRTAGTTQAAAAATAKAAPTVFATLANAKQNTLAATRSIPKTSAPEAAVDSNPHSTGSSHANPHPTSNPHHDTTDSDHVLNWSIRIRAKHNELTRPFSVLVFLGHVPEDHTQWLDSPNLVGAEHCFANSALTSCANCRNQAEAVSEGFIHLNDFIAEHNPELGTFDEDVIKPYLQQNLSWRAMDLTETPVEVTSLEVTAFAVPMSWGINADFPTSGRIRYHHDITHGKPGGSRAGQV